MSRRSKEDCKCRCDNCFAGLHELCQDDGCSESEYGEYEDED